MLDCTYIISLGIDRKRKEVESEIKKQAKAGKLDVCRVLAKEVAQAKRAVNKLYAARAHMNSILLEIDRQSAMLRMSQAIKMSGEVSFTLF